MMTRAEKNTRTLVKAVMANRLPLVKQIMEEGIFNRTVLEDIFEGVDDIFCTIDAESLPKFPLYGISLCNLLNLTGHWSPFWAKTMDENIASCQALIEYWRGLGYPVDHPIDFARYRALINRYWMLESIEDHFGADLEKLISMGYHEDEIRLCHALYTYDKDTLFALLEKGVNPDVCISGDYGPGICEEFEACNGYELIVDTATEAVLESGLSDFYRSKDDNLPELRVEHFYALFQGAAYSEILNKLSEMPS